MRNGLIAQFINIAALSAMLVTSGCAMVGVPDARNVNIPTPTTADVRRPGINERPDSVMYLPLGEDVLVPEVAEDDPFPHEMVGPFELRGETLAGALQLILADYDISLAFETQEGLSRRITVANLRGDLGKVVHQVCSLANLYCSYEDGTIVVKDTQTFTVSLPPIGTSDESEFLTDVAEGLAAILNPVTASGTATATAAEPIVDNTTRTIVYSATQRTAEIASRYFQRLRANTAMIVFETYIWEVSLDSGNSTGVDWFKLAQFGRFNTGISVDGQVGADFLRPVTIGIPTASGEFDGTSGDLIRFLSQFGTVKTISQPQITVLSGSEAELRVADTQNYVSQIATTLDEGQSTTSVNTDSVDTGFTLTIGSTWDKATVYANVNLELTNVNQIEDFSFTNSGEDGGSTTIQLPQTSERQLSTQLRVRPGDSMLIAGLVRENDNFNTRGIGLMQPIIPDSRTAQTQNLELVILLRPRVIVYTASNDKRYVDYMMKKHKMPGTGVEVTSPKELGEPVERGNVYKSEAVVPVVNPIQEEIPSGVPAPLTKEPLPVAPAKPEPIAMPPAMPVVPSSTLTPPPPATTVPVTPSWQQSGGTPPRALPETAPAPAAISSSGSRFARSGGFVSRGNGLSPASSPSPALAQPAVSAPAPVMPSPAAVEAAPMPLYREPSVTVSPLPAPVMPVPAPISAMPTPATPAAAPSAPLSIYETYDYYTPGP